MPRAVDRRLMPPPIELRCAKCRRTLDTVRGDGRIELKLEKENEHPPVVNPDWHGEGVADGRFVSRTFTCRCLSGRSTPRSYKITEARLADGVADARRRGRRRLYLGRDL